MKRIFLFLVGIIFTFSLSSQNATVSGTVTDLNSGETITGASITLVDKPTLGVASNAYGYYSLTLPLGQTKLKVRFIGYQEKLIDVNLTENTKLNISLSPKNSSVKEVVISAKKQATNVSNVQVSKIQVDLAEIDKLPVILGEKDVLKSIQLLPGIMPAQEGNSGFIVRGGNTDQNLILLDEAPVYNASHLLGFFSTFNSDALKDMTLYKGNMPAEYGGRLSSVVDIKMKEGNNKNYNIGGGIGLIASRLYAEGPIVKDKGSFFVSGRRTYADVFLALSSDSAVKQSTLYFYDFNAKANYRLGKKDKVFISGYFGKDKFGLANLFGITYGNTTFTNRWNHIFSDKLFSNTSLIYNNFNYQVKINVNDFDLFVNSILNDYSLKQDFDYFLNSKNKLKFGYLGTWHNVVPGDITSSDTIISKNGLSRSNGFENSIYIQNEMDVSPKLKINYGLRLSSFTVAGKNKLYSYDALGNTLDTTILEAMVLDKTYFNPEPRISANYSKAENKSIKIAYSRNVQNIHQLSNTTSGSPTDRWVLTSRNIHPGISDQISAGYYFNFGGDMFEASVETYYKHLQNQIDYKNGTVIRANETVEKDLLYGQGRAYGLEFYIKKRLGNLTGWISYTLSRSERQFDQINNGEWFASRYDRTHDLSVVAMYEISPRVSISGAFVFYTGNAVTFPNGKYNISGNLDPNQSNAPIFTSYSGRNEDRFPSYNRLDLACTYKLKKTKHWEHDLNFSVYNILGTKNPYTIDFKNEVTTNQTFVEKTYLFRFVPAITYNFKFSQKKQQ